MKVRFTGSARGQFLDAIRYIRADDPIAARRFRERALEVLSRLVSFPQSGRTIPEFPDWRYREVIVHPYRFFYRVEGDAVWIVAVWHGRQVPSSP